jgi:hypothetical protein
MHQTEHDFDVPYAEELIQQAVLHERIDGTYHHDIKAHMALNLRRLLHMT